MLKLPARSCWLALLLVALAVESDQTTKGAAAKIGDVANPSFDVLRTTTEKSSAVVDYQSTAAAGGSPILLPRCPPKVKVQNESFNTLAHRQPAVCACKFL